MRIGLIAPPWVPVPPPAYGGTEAVVDNLAQGLMSRGHEVVLFTVAESTCPADVRSLYPTAVAPIGDAVLESAHVLAAYAELGAVDIIHDHSVLGPLIAARNSPAPVVVTNHGPFTDRTRPIFAEISSNASIIAISHAQAFSAGDVPIAAVIHHGINLESYEYGPGGGGYAMFIGRACPEKGVHRAVRVAREAGMPLLIVTKAREPQEQDYLENVVRPMLSDGDQLIGEAGLADRVQLLRHADVLINPLDWPEPFGLVMAESLACGTPVVALPCGAAPEIIDHGRTGFLCGSEDEMAAAVVEATTLSRVDCRTAVEQRFSLHRMVADHEWFYRTVLRRHDEVPAPRQLAEVTR